MPNNEIEPIKTLRLTVLDGATGNSRQEVVSSPTIWGVRAMISWVHDTYFFAGDVQHSSEASVPVPAIFSHIDSGLPGIWSGVTSWAYKHERPGVPAANEYYTVDRLAINEQASVLDTSFVLSGVAQPRTSTGDYVLVNDPTYLIFLYKLDATDPQCFSNGFAVLAHQIFDITPGKAMYRKLLNYASMTRQAEYTCCDTLYFSEVNALELLDQVGKTDARISVYELPSSGNFDC